MNQKSYQAITALLNAFPQSSADLRGLLLTYEQVLTGIEDRAIEEAAMRFMAGDVREQSRTFAPSVAEFTQEARKQQEVIGLRAKPRLPRPQYRSGPLAPFQIRQEKLRAENARRSVLFEDVNFETWKRLSAERAVPAGAKWVAVLGTIYGPEPKQQSEAA